MKIKSSTAETTTFIYRNARERNRHVNGEYGHLHIIIEVGGKGTKDDPVFATFLNERK